MVPAALVPVRRWNTKRAQDQPCCSRFFVSWLAAAHLVPWLPVDDRVEQFLFVIGVFLLFDVICTLSLSLSLRGRIVVLLDIFVLFFCQPTAE